MKRTPDFFCIRHTEVERLEGRGNYFWSCLMRSTYRPATSDVLQLHGCGGDGSRSGVEVGKGSQPIRGGSGSYNGRKDFPGRGLKREGEYEWVLENMNNYG